MSNVLALILAFLSPPSAVEAGRSPSFVIYSYVVCAGVCPATVIWLDGDGPDVEAAQDYRDMSGLALAARGPRHADSAYLLDRADVERAVGRLGGERLVACEQQAQWSGDGLHVRIVRDGVCRHGELSGAGYADFAALRCRLLRQNGEPESDPRCPEALPER